MRQTTLTQSVASGFSSFCAVMDFCHLDLSILYLIASCDECHDEADGAYSIRSTWSCY